ncbi:hypothetical protein O3P69_001548 [Scylla paramamosain]|uniref:Uncharacterized protein n=1 Tax=Scylla paramamosain TaxID=85552 RepID=A0AAW0UY41_SCYPA
MGGGRWRAAHDPPPPRPPHHDCCAVTAVEPSRIRPSVRRHGTRRDKDVPGQAVTFSFLLFFFSVERRAPKCITGNDNSDGKQHELSIHPPRSQCGGAEERPGEDVVCPARRHWPALRIVIHEREIKVAGSDLQYCLLGTRRTREGRGRRVRACEGVRVCGGGWARKYGMHRGGKEGVWLPAPPDPTRPSPAPPSPPINKNVLCADIYRRRKYSDSHDFA